MSTVEKEFDMLRSSGLILLMSKSRRWAGMALCPGQACQVWHCGKIGKCTWIGIGRMAHHWLSLRCTSALLLQLRYNFGLFILTHILRQELFPHQLLVEAPQRRIGFFEHLQLGRPLE
eukprot:scaffold105167_cov30-Tisochrysis_lutea.AAC.2